MCLVMDAVAVLPNYIKQTILRKAISPNLQILSIQTRNIQTRNSLSTRQARHSTGRQTAKVAGWLRGPFGVGRRLWYPCSSGVVLNRQHLADFICRHRLREQIALPEIATNGTQHVLLSVVFDTLRDDEHAKIMGQTNAVADDGAQARVGGDGADKRAIQFENVAGQGVQVTERRIAGTEVVDQHRNPGFAQLLQGFGGRAAGKGKETLRDFEAQQFGGEAVAGDGVEQFGSEIGTRELPRRKVDTDRFYAFDPDLADPLLQVETGAVEYEHAEFVHQIERFGQRNENARRNEFLFGVLPARESLEADDVGIEKTNDGLVGDAQFFFR